MSDNNNFEDPSESTRGRIVGDTDDGEFENDVTAAMSVEWSGAADKDRVSNGDCADADLVNGSSEVPDGPVCHPITDDEALEPGFILRDRFEIVALAHSGGMGHVYKALDKRRHRIASERVHVAIKMMRRSIASGQEARFALEREAAKTQRLSHPNIVNIFDFDQHDDQFYLVMEWLEGESINALLRRIRGRPLEPHFAWRVIQGIASGLQHAHSNNVIHADVNPSNIFISDTQEIKLLDFGVARYKSDAEAEAKSDVLWTTQSYASPEVLSGLAPTAADDIFSLGCVAYRMLAGRHPFRGHPSIKAQESEMTVIPVPGLADSLWQVLRQALSYERSGRPAAASAFLIDIPSATDVAQLGPVTPRSFRQWLPALALGAISALGWTWWQQQNGTANAPKTVAETTLSDAALADIFSTPEVEEAIEPTELEILSDSAAQAMEENRILEPEDDNARDFYRDAPTLDPVDPIAISGLRNISDVQLQKAETAGDASQPANAVTALGITAETDTENSSTSTSTSTSIAKESLHAQANGELADARLAAADGDVDRAREMLRRAEQYGVIDTSEIDAVWNQIVQSERERDLLFRLDVADNDLAAGRLTAPIGDNAHETLIDLQNSYGADPRVVAAMERLVEQLMTQAIFAAAAGRFTVATESLDAAAQTGVLAVEVSAAQTSLRRALDKESDQAVAALSAVKPPPADSTLQTDILPTKSDVALPASGSTSPTTLPTSPISSQDHVALADAVDPASAVPNDARIDQVAQFVELDIEKYVAPNFPQRAKLDELNGFVELQFNVNTDGSTSDIEVINSAPRTTFVRSARNAVQQWRFAKRDDVIKAQVKLRFEWESD